GILAHICQEGLDRNGPSCERQIGAFGQDRKGLNGLLFAAADGVVQRFGDGRFAAAASAPERLARRGGPRERFFGSVYVLDGVQRSAEADERSRVLGKELQRASEAGDRGGTVAGVETGKTGALAGVHLELGRARGAAVGRAASGAVGRVTAPSDAPADPGRACPLAGRVPRDRDRRARYVP